VLTGNTATTDAPTLSCVRHLRRSNRHILALINKS